MRRLWYQINILLVERTHLAKFALPSALALCIDIREFWLSFCVDCATLDLGGSEAGRSLFAESILVLRSETPQVGSTRRFVLTCLDEFVMSVLEL